MSSGKLMVLACRNSTLRLWCNFITVNGMNDVHILIIYKNWLNSDCRGSQIKVGRYFGYVTFIVQFQFTTHRRYEFYEYALTNYTTTWRYCMRKQCCIVRSGGSSSKSNLSSCSRVNSPWLIIWQVSLSIIKSAVTVLKVI